METDIRVQEDVNFCLEKLLYNCYIAPHWTGWERELGFKMNLIYEFIVENRCLYPGVSMIFADEVSIKQ